MLRRWWLVVLAPLCGLAWMCGTAQASPGALDPSFGIGGVALTSIGSGGNALATATAPTSDGGLVAAGSAINDGGALELALDRYTAGGTLDTSFGSGGLVVANLGYTTSQATAVAVESNGDVLVAGSADTSAPATEVLLALYSPSGVLVPSFGTGGKVLLAVGTDDNSQADAIVLDGANVLVAGQAGEGGNTEMFFASVSASTGAENGSPTLISLGDTTDTVANAIALDGSDAILAGSTENGSTSAKELALAEVTASGTLVPGFGSGGTVTQPVGSSDAIGDGVTVEPGGRIVVSGSVVVNGNTDVLLSGFTAGGVLDSSFGTGGSTELAIGSGGNAIGAAVAVTPEGGLAVAGQAADALSSQPANLPLVARLSATGSLDPSFAPSSPEPGTELLACSTDSGFTSAFVQSNGEIVAAGNSGADSNNQAFLAARLLDTQSGAGSGGGCTPNTGGGGGGGGGTPTTPTPGTGTPPGTGSNCTATVKSIGILEVRACFTRQGTLLVAKGTIDIDGLSVVPSPCTSLVFDTTANTIRTECDQGGEGEVAVSLTGVPLYRGSLDWSVPTSSGGALGPITAGAFADLQGFAIVGQIDIDAVSGGAVDVNISTDLPAPFDVIHGAATLQANLTHGLELSSLDVSVSDVFLGPVEVKNLSVDYNGATDTWTGAADAALPPPLLYDVTANTAFQDGNFKYFTASVNNLNIALGSVVFLQQIGFGFQASPFEVEGTIGLSIGPQILGVNAIGINGQLILEIPSGGWDIRLSGQASIVDVPLASAYVEIDNGNAFFFGGGINYGDCSELCINANVTGWLDLSQGTFDAYASAQLGVLGYNALGGQVDVSSRAISGCAQISFLAFDASVGGAYVWGGGFHALGDVTLGPSGASCDLSPYRPTAPTQVIGTGGGLPGLTARQEAHLTAVTSDRVTVPAHTHGLVWAIQGSGAAPQVAISGPGGEHLQTNAAGTPVKGPDDLILQDPQGDTTYVILAKPRAGHWLLTPLGTTKISSIHTAGILPPPAVKAHVTGTGRARTLDYKVTTEPGQKVRFLEHSGKLTSPIATTTKAAGAVHFTPADGPGGRRQILAEVLEGMTVRKRMTVSSYIAPANLGPAKPTHLAILRHGSKVRISWRRATGSDLYLVTVDRSDGSDRQVVVHGTQLTVTGFPAFAGAKVTVAGRTTFGQQGSPGSVTLATPQAPKLRRAPTVTGQATVGLTVACRTGTWTAQPTKYVIEWLLDGVTIAHADQRTLKLKSAQRGKRISCMVTARNGAGYAVATSKALKVAAKSRKPKKPKK